MGSLARVHVIYDDLEIFIGKHAGIPVLATTLDGKPLAGFQKQKQGMLLIGNESRGINPALLALSTEKITIPKYGAAESLNAAVATGIILSHLL